MKKIIIIAVIAIIMPSMLIMSAFIPKSAIRKGTLSSAEYLNSHDMFGCVIDGVEGSRIDGYADSILLNIAYHLDKNHPLKSVALSAYYFTPDHEENENLLIAVRDDPGMNRQYLRYWHGSIAFIRPLLTMMPIQGIFIVNSCIMIALFAVYVILLLRMKEYVPVISMTIALILTMVWFVPLSLEYTWMIMLMLVCSIAVIILYSKGLQKYYGLLFVLSGMATAFVDFLTTETLSLLVPILIMIRLERSRDMTSKEIYTAPVRYSIEWGIAYALMWSSKWLFTSIVMKENAMPYVLEHVEERIGGDLGLSMWQYITGAVKNNIGCLFPLGYGAVGYILFIALIIYAIYRAFVYRTGGWDGRRIAVMAVIGLVPYIRYLVLHNHSYIHCFFTFRAQLATVMAVVLILSELTGHGSKAAQDPCDKIA